MNAGLLGMAGGPQRIVCLTEETTEWLYLLGEEARIVGISGFTVRPRRAPDIIIGSWCGKKFRPEKVTARPGWQDVPAVRDGQLFEIKSPDILQPGPAALTDGAEQLHRIVMDWMARHG